MKWITRERPWAISAGLSRNYSDDYQQLEIGMKIYDALYSWAKYALEERHNWDPDLLTHKKP